MKGALGVVLGVAYARLSSSAILEWNKWYKLGVTVNDKAMLLSSCTVLRRILNFSANILAPGLCLWVQPLCGQSYKVKRQLLSNMLLENTTLQVLFTAWTILHISGSTDVYCQMECPGYPWTWYVLWWGSIHYLPARPFTTTIIRHAPLCALYLPVSHTTGTFCTYMIPVCHAIFVH